MSEDSFIYVFTLLYSPSPLGSTQIIRARDVTITIQCHYHRSEFTRLNQIFFFFFERSILILYTLGTELLVIGFFIYYVIQLLYSLM